MKGLIIIGVARCGKSTLSYLVSQQLAMAGYKVNLLTGDLIKYAHNEAFRRGLWYKLFWRPLKNIFPTYCRRMTDETLTRRERYKMVYDYLIAVTWQQAEPIPVFEVAMDPEFARKLFPADKFKIVLVASPNMTPQEKFAIMRRLDKKSWDGQLSDKELMDTATYLVKSSKELTAQAKKYNIPVIDTSHDYHGELKKFADNVVDFLK